MIHSNAFAWLVLEIKIMISEFDSENILPGLVINREGIYSNFLVFFFFFNIIIIIIHTCILYEFSELPDAWNDSRTAMDICR